MCVCFLFFLGGGLVRGREEGVREGDHVSGMHIFLVVVLGGRADAERAEQEQQLLCRVDPQQCEDGCLRHPAPRPQNVLHLHR